jgi:large subunit ribosomal protein L4
MYRAAMRAILSELVRQERFVVVDSLSLDESKTKLMIAKLKEFGTNDVLLVSDVADTNILLASRNIAYCEVSSVVDLNPVSLVGHEKVVMTRSAVEKIQEWLA